MKNKGPLHVTESRQHLQGHPLLCLGSGHPPVSSTDPTWEPQRLSQSVRISLEPQDDFFQIFLCTERDLWYRFKCLYLHGLFYFFPETHHPALVEIQPCTCIGCTRRVSAPPHRAPALSPCSCHSDLGSSLLPSQSNLLSPLWLPSQLHFFQASTKKRLWVVAECSSPECNLKAIIFHLCNTLQPVT